MQDESKLRQALKLVKDYCNTQEDCSECIFRTVISIGDLKFDHCEYDEVTILWPQEEDY